jgi:ABC-type dipeptide/oligopeptide/nickel transport system permease subunit
MQGLPLNPTWNWHHFFLGTDSSGRDEMSQLLYGTRVSMEVGFMATLITLVIGVVIGLISGYLGGMGDNVIMRITDVVLAFPLFLFVILLRSVVTHPTVATVYTVIGVLGWAGIARITRGQTLAARKLEYVESARSIGARVPSILFKHIFPNIMGPIVVYGTLLIANNILLESALSFLSIGVPDPTVSWGKMINLGLSWYQTDPWLIVWPGIAIAIATLGFNLLGDGLSDALNPRANQ